MEKPMTHSKFILAVLLAFLTAGCAGEPIFEDRSDEVKITHRVPSR
jgi:hypothetical protein